jgi:hypothetical protein
MPDERLRHLIAVRIRIDPVISHPQTAIDVGAMATEGMMEYRLRFNDGESATPNSHSSRVDDHPDASIFPVYEDIQAFHEHLQRELVSDEALCCEFSRSHHGDGCLPGIWVGTHPVDINLI